MKGGRRQELETRESEEEGVIYRGRSIYGG